MKGPVNGARVFAYLVTANGKGALSGACTTTNSAGEYTLNAPARTGDLLIEASGGTYIDEVTGLVTNFPGSSVMTSLVTANGGVVEGMVTPFTTLAINSAIDDGALNAAGYQVAIAEVLSSFSLPASLNLTTADPVFGIGINAYGIALTVISNMINNGTSLSNLLSGLVTPAMIAAYEAAENTIPSTSTSVASASGTLTLTGAGNNFTPSPTGFTVKVNRSSVEYDFSLPVTLSNGGKTTSNVQIKLANSSNPAVYYVDAQSGFGFDFIYGCTSNCGVTISTPAGATHPVTVTFTNTPLSGGRTLNGTLVGDVTGAIVWTPADFPSASNGQLTINGAAAPVITASFVRNSGTSTGFSANITLADGSLVSASTVNGGAVNRVALAGVLSSELFIQQCNSNCGVTFTESTSGLSITFANTPLASGVSLNGTVFIRKTQGSVTVGGTLGTFTPVDDSVDSDNDILTFTFQEYGANAQGGLNYLSVVVRGSTVLSITGTAGIANTLYYCFEIASPFLNAPACSGATMAADRRTITFNNTALSGGATLNGTLTSRGR